MSKTNGSRPAIVSMLRCNFSGSCDVRVFWNDRCDCEAIQLDLGVMSASVRYQRLKTSSTELPVHPNILVPLNGYLEINPCW